MTHKLVLLLREIMGLPPIKWEKPLPKIPEVFVPALKLREILERARKGQ